MQATLSVIILVLAIIITASALVAVLILTASKNRQLHNKARMALILTFIFEVLLGIWKITGAIGNPDSIMDFHILQFPEAVAFLCFQSWMFAYPMAILRPDKTTWKTFFIMTLPYLFIGLLYEILPFEPIILERPEEILQHISEPDVLYRIGILAFFLPYSVMLPFLHLRTKEVSISSLGIFVYMLNIICLSILLSFYILTVFPYFLILYFIIGFCNNIYAVYYEQNIREIADRNLKANTFQPAAPDPAVENRREEQSDTTEGSEKEDSIETEEENVTTTPVKGEGEEEIGMTSLLHREGNYRSKDEMTSMDLVHEELCEAFNVRNIWKRSDLTIDILAKEIGTNKTYIQKCIKAATGYNYTEFVNRERVRFIEKALTAKPDRDLKKIFSEAGYASRTTGWRNFKKITGLSPKEYVQKVKNG